MLSVLTAVHILIAITLIGLILIQRGRGADIGAAFGSGASQTVFGSRGSASFLTRTTAVLATLFFLSSLGLAYLYSQQAERKSVTERLPPVTEPAPGESVPAPPVDVPEAPGPGSSGAGGEETPAP